LAPPATVERTEAELSAAHKGIDDRTPWSQAAQEFNAAPSSPGFVTGLALLNQRAPARAHPSSS